MKSLKLLKVAMKHSILTDKVKFETIHSNKCLIDLDSHDEEVSQTLSDSDQDDYSLNNQDENVYR